MKKLAFLAIALFVGIGISSCERVNIEESGINEAQLRAGTWTIQHVEANTFNSGTLIESDVVLFGEGKEGGICTFTYTEDSKWVMDDNGFVNTLSYEIEDNVITTAGGAEWGLRVMSDTHLELTLRGEQNSNPCEWSSTGSVYFLDREEATKQ